MPWYRSNLSPLRLFKYDDNRAFGIFAFFVDRQRAGVGGVDGKKCGLVVVSSEWVRRSSFSVFDAL